MKRPEWAERPERSNLAALRVMTWVSLHLGRPFSRLVLQLGTLYFVLCSPAACRASRDYLRRTLGRPAGRVSMLEVYRHMLTFGTTIHDRIYLMHARFDLFDIQLQGQEHVHEVLAQGRGAFLLGAHLGSFEVVRALGRTVPDLRVSVAMYEDNARNINAAVAAINPAAAPEIIPLGRVDAMLQVREALDDNRLVGMLADRTLLRDAGASVQRVDFLGAPAAFPLGPLHMAAMLKRPVLFMSGLHLGGNRYAVQFDKLADFTNLQREDRAAAVQAALARYVEHVEHCCRTAPYNWFNFFDFWQDASATEQHPAGRPEGQETQTP
ncbi:acyl-CoA synthetase [Ralstonia sp. A12]|uniref:LpxL/LpxP family acyltransferase n=1 Tax=Ralstonia sp. A12 TaxID=1217052 RepID=UPI000573FB07|nr:acyl-CoA synthetase [Ralstonia sp. A12]KHK53702.1 acyl-CoA synthetase [Ralstonia sp. A12]